MGAITGTSAFLTGMVKLPIWLYIVYHLVNQADIPAGMLLFWIYVVFSAISFIVQVIALGLDEVQ